MNAEQKGFQDKQYYPIVFMLLITVFFVGILSVFYRSTEKAVAAYQKQMYQKQILSLFADTLSTLTGYASETFIDKSKVDSNFEKYVSVMEQSTPFSKAVAAQYYAVRDADDNLIGYCFDVTGSGLWGTMKGLLAVTMDFKKVVNFAIYSQMETPGLGSRVEEDWFKHQFAGKPFQSEADDIVFSLVLEDALAETHQIKQITGATITSSSVLKMLRVVAQDFRQHPLLTPSKDNR